jgi:ATP-dependent Lon protease
MKFQDQLNILGPEDEMDFLPIIPLNEQDAESFDPATVPSELTLLPLRNTVLFPGVVLPITVGRDKSIRAVNEAYSGDRLIGVVAQKDPAVEDPGGADLETVGTVARIVKQIKMPDGGITIIIQARHASPSLRSPPKSPGSARRWSLLPTTRYPLMAISVPMWPISRTSPPN